MRRALLLLAAAAAALPALALAQDRDARGRLREAPWVPEAPPPVPVPLPPRAADPVDPANVVGAGPLTGVAHGGTESWSFVLTLTLTDPATGMVAGEIEWIGDTALHRVEGWLGPDGLSFTEVAAIRPGTSILGCTFALPLVAAAGPMLEGRWSCPDGQSGSVTLSLVN